MSHGPRTQTPFESAVRALADDWKKSYADLSPESQTTVRALGIGQQIWDVLNAEGRAKLAADFDAQHDPATKELREELWRLEADKARLLQMPVLDPVNFEARRLGLGRIERELEALDARAPVAPPIPLRSGAKARRAEADAAAVQRHVIAQARAGGIASGQRRSSQARVTPAQVHAAWDVLEASTPTRQIAGKLARRFNVDAAYIRRQNKKRD